MKVLKPVSAVVEQYPIAKRLRKRVMREEAAAAWKAGAVPRAMS